MRVRNMIITMLQLVRSKLYKVKNGQTVKGLAEELSTTAYAIVGENALLEELYEGQVIFLPQEANLYIVQAGDTKTLLCGGEEAYARKNRTAIFYPGMRVLL